MLSKFLPDNFDKGSPVAVIAGRDNYPLIMVKRMLEAGITVKLISFKGETCDELLNMFSPEEQESIKVGQLGHMLKALKKFSVKHAVMAGQVTPGKLFKGMQPDLKALTVLGKLKERNAETIFGAIAEEMSKIGITLMDARVFMDNDLAEKGLMSGKKFKVSDEHLRHGIDIAKNCAAKDIGQGVVVNEGTVLAVEAFEGTDKMLARAGSFGAKNAVFVKTVKAEQDYRFDVPVFGMRTLDTLSEAKIKNAALETENVLILDKEEVLKEAGKRGIAIIGY